MALASVPVQEVPWLEGSGASRQRSFGWGSHTAALQPASGFDSFEYAIVFTIGQIVKFGVLQVVAKLVLHLSAWQRGTQQLPLPLGVCYGDAGGG